MWCVIGCSIGDFGTILFFQLTKIPFPVLGNHDLSNHKWFNNKYYSRNNYSNETKF
jgi:hypothetical protein